MQESLEHYTVMNYYQAVTACLSCREPFSHTSELPTEIPAPTGAVAVTSAKQDFKSFLQPRTSSQIAH